MDFRILEWISGFQSGFLDFKVDFWISLDFWISDWISADSVRDFFRGGPLVHYQPDHSKSDGYGPATMCLGLLPHHRGRMSNSSVATLYLF